MGRRVRHFNPVHAGAGFAIDARYLTGYSNGASVTSWGSRPGVSFTFTESSNYPTFSASVTAAANQPGVSFTAGSAHRLISTDTPVVGSGSNTFTYVEFSTGGNGFISMSQHAAATGRTVIGCYFQSTGYDLIHHRGYFDWYNTGGIQQTLDEGTYTNGLVCWGRQNGTTQEAGLRWATPSSRTSSGTIRVSGAGNSTPNDHRTGVHHASALFNAAVPNPLLRRIVDHYAFSFKSAI